MKQHVIRAILRDIFQIPSLRISFSSLGISKTSDGILFPSDKIWERSEKIKKISENGEKSLRIRARFLGGMIVNSHTKH